MPSGTGRRPSVVTQTWSLSRLSFLQMPLLDISCLITAYLQDIAKTGGLDVQLHFMQWSVVTRYAIRDRLLSGHGHSAIGRADRNTAGDIG